MTGFYVYAYLDPRNEGLFEGHRGFFTQNKMKAIRSSGLDPIVEIVKDECSERDALCYEKELNGLSYSFMRKVSKGTIPDHKGWKCEAIRC